MIITLSYFATVGFSLLTLDSILLIHSKNKKTRNLSFLRKSIFIVSFIPLLNLPIVMFGIADGFLLAYRSTRRLVADYWFKLEGKHTLTVPDEIFDEHETNLQEDVRLAFEPLVRKEEPRLGKMEYMIASDYFNLGWKEAIKKYSK
jgi:hypothetical protein